MNTIWDIIRQNFMFDSSVETSVINIQSKQATLLFSTRLL